MSRQHNNVTYWCPACSGREDIPLSVVLDFDAADAGDPSYPPRFYCQHCPDVLMWPIFYRGLHGFTYSANPITRQITVTPPQD